MANRQRTFWELYGSNTSSGPNRAVITDFPDEKELSDKVSRRRDRCIGGSLLGTGREEHNSS